METRAVAVVENTFFLLAEAFRYPAPGRRAALEEGFKNLPASEPAIQKEAMQAFLDKTGCLSLGEWEELHTRTLDLNPPAAPYVGFQIWGENYQRGVFLSGLNQELAEKNIDLEGELADHLIPVLRYLGQVEQPMPKLIEVLVPAIQRMRAVLFNADPGNPYLDLLEAAQMACKQLKKEAA